MRKSKKLIALSMAALMTAMTGSVSYTHLYMSLSSRGKIVVSWDCGRR